MLAVQSPVLIASRADRFGGLLTYSVEVLLHNGVGDVCMKPTSTWVGGLSVRAQELDSGEVSLPLSKSCPTFVGVQYILTGEFIDEL